MKPLDGNMLIKDNYVESQTQLWNEEPACLHRYASLVSRNGTIVEIGTADGGTANIIRNATNKKNIGIYTIDIAPSKKAYSILKNSNVNIIKGHSIQVATNWNKKINRQIDMLYIDGSHFFEDVHNDFLYWMPNLKPMAIIVFHDYDPPERGGLAHFGIEVFLKTVLRFNILIDISHDYRFLFGRIIDKSHFNIKIDDYFETFQEIGRGVIDIREKIFSNADNALNNILNRDHEITSLQACYCIDHLFNEYYETLINPMNSSEDIKPWCEMLYIIEHAYGKSLFPDNIQLIRRLTTIHDLSLYITREQLKLKILYQILKRLVPWTP